MPKSRKSEQNSKPTYEVGSGNIFKDLGFPDEEAVNLFARGQLALEIRDIIEKNGWSQRQAAKEMDIPQPRIAEIMKMKIDHYSIDMLLKYLDKLGRKVSFHVEMKNKVAEQGIDYVAKKCGKTKTKLAPIDDKEKTELIGCLDGSVAANDDIVAPLDLEWETMK